MAGAVALRWRRLHSARQVLGNLACALRIGGLLHAVTAVPALRERGGPAGGPAAAVPFGGLWGLLILVPVRLVATILAHCWIAVGRHRFVLREEHPAGALPRRHGREVRAHVLRSLQIAVILLAAALVTGVLVALVVAADPGAGPATILAANVLTVIVVWIALRIGLGLLGARLGLGASWRASAAVAGPAFVAAAPLALLGVVGGALSGAPPAPLGVVVGPAGDWIALMLGIAVPTTLHGHLIEGRDLG